MEQAAAPKVSFVSLGCPKALVDSERIITRLRAEGYAVEDLGTNGPDSVDYPDFGYALGEAIAAGRADRGVALCGSGVGISISVNRNPACRCALVSELVGAPDIAAKVRSVRAAMSGGL